MWICPKCREKIEDQFDTCWRCAAKPGELVPDVEPATAISPENRPPRPPPYFGVLSLAFPLLGVPFAYMVTTPSQEGWGWGGAVQLIGIMFASVVLGLFSAVVGLTRREKFRGFSIVGLVLNGFVVILAL